MTATYRISLVPPDDAERRCMLRLLAMVLELHKAGYQRLRVVPGMSPSGMHWRCCITSANNVRANGWEPKDWEAGIAVYTSGQKDRYFDWHDGQGKTARQLAAMFLKRFPELARSGAGWDWPYAGWFVTMLGAAEAGDLPVYYADHDVDLPTVGLPPSPEASHLA